MLLRWKYGTIRISFFTAVTSENVIGLQVADLIAYPITRHVLNPDGVNLAYDVLKKNIYQVDGKMYGMKVFPQEK